MIFYKLAHTNVCTELNIDQVNSRIVFVAVDEIMFDHFDVVYCFSSWNRLLHSYLGFENVGTDS